MRLKIDFSIFLMFLLISFVPLRNDSYFSTIFKINNTAIIKNNIIEKYKINNSSSNDNGNSASYNPIPITILEIARV